MAAVGSRKLRRLLASVSMLGVLVGCSVAPKPFTSAELGTQAAEDRAAMFATDAQITRPLTLADAIARALKYNLDHRTKVMEKALAMGQTDLDRWDLLPKVTADAGYLGRSDHGTASSRDSVTQLPAISNPYYSTDRDRLTADLGMSWNILDFGVSYYNAKQNADRALIAEEHRRKTIQNLTQEVRFAYWRMAAAQVLRNDVQRAVAEADKALGEARAVERANLKNPAETLRYQKTMLENLRQLEAIDQELSTAKVELAALVNQPPGADFTVEVPANEAMTLPSFTLSIEQMEELAFVNNPDLHEQGYMTRIAVDEARKAILKLLPGISLSASSQWDSNSFLVNNHWYESGIRISWNLINLLSAPDQLSQADATKKVANARRMALRMSVLAKVHVSYLQLLNAEKQFERADELYQVETRLARFATVRADNDAQSVMERVANQTSAIAASLRRYQSYAQMQSALGKVYATLGQDFPLQVTSSADIDAVSQGVAASLDSWGREPKQPAVSPQVGKVAAPSAPPPVVNAPTPLPPAVLPQPAPQMAKAVVAPVALPPSSPAAGTDTSFSDYFQRMNRMITSAARNTDTGPGR